MSTTVRAAVVTRYAPRVVTSSSGSPAWVMSQPRPRRHRWGSVRCTVSGSLLGRGSPQTQAARGAAHHRGGTAEARGHCERVQAGAAPGPLDLCQVDGGHEDPGPQPHPRARVDRRPDLPLAHSPCGEISGREDAEPATGRFGDGEGHGGVGAHRSTVDRSEPGDRRSSASVDPMTGWGRRVGRGARRSAAPACGWTSGQAAGGGVDGSGRRRSMRLNLTHDRTRRRGGRGDGRAGRARGPEGARGQREAR